MKRKLFISMIIACATVGLTGCSSSKKTALNVYNEYVDAISSSDFNTALNLVYVEDNTFIDEDTFEEALYNLNYNLPKASKVSSVKDKSDYWNFETANGSFELQVINNKIVLPELMTSLELYVPTGSNCTYNGVTLTPDYITYSDELETTYTIVAPYTVGTLEMHTSLFGDSEREVDPDVGDYFEFTLSDDMIDELSTAVLNEIKKLNDALDKADYDTVKSLLSQYVEDEDEQSRLIDKLKTNRKVEDVFTGYHDVTYTIKNATADLDTVSSIIADFNFNVSWTVGENSQAEMTTKGSFTIEKTDKDWNVISVDNWDFMILNGR